MDIKKHHIKKESTNPFVICDNFIKGPKTNAYVFGKTWVKKFDTTLRSMFDCIQSLEKDEGVDDFTYTPVEECLNFLQSITIEKQANEEFIEFIKNFIYIAHNINQNLNKYEGVTRKIAYLQRYADEALTYSETLSLMNKVKSRIVRWRDLTPPSFRLSRHYYNLLKED